MRFFAIALTLLLSFSIAPLAAGTNIEASAINKPFSPEDEGLLLTLSGSNTVGGALAPAWARAYLEAKGARAVTTMMLPTENEYRILGRNGDRLVFIDIRAHGSSTGFTSLTKGEADVAMSSRPIKAQERQDLLALGDLFATGAEHVVAIDGLAVIVHPNNPLTQLSVDAIAAIFAGKIRNWQELGGADIPITLYARDQKSGTWDTFQSLVLGEHKLSGRAQRFESNDALSDSVAQDPAAIGFVGLASVRSAKALAVHHGASPAMRPDKRLVATEDYPLARRLYLYQPMHSHKAAAQEARNPNPVTSEFIGFAQHEVGQRLVEEVGFVAQTPMEMAVVEDSGPEFYRALANHAQRLSLNFRFRPGSADLDSKAKRDIARLVTYLKQRQALHIQLVGFSHTQRDAVLTSVLSRLRATAVKSALFEQGIITESVMGFGDSRPLSTGKDGKSKNDRVEVWLYPSASAAAVALLKASENTEAHLDPTLELARQP